MNRSALQVFRSMTALQKVAVSDEYLAQGAGGAVRGAMLTGAVAGGVAGGGLYYLLREENVQRAAQALSERMRVPLAVAVGIITGFVAAKKVGVPLGAALGLSDPPRRRLPPPPQEPGRMVGGPR